MNEPDRKALPNSVKRTTISFSIAEIDILGAECTIYITEIGLLTFQIGRPAAGCQCATQKYDERKHFRGQFTA